MTITISWRRILIGAIVAALATLAWWIGVDVLRWPEWLAMLIFGFILIALGVSIT